MLRSLLALAAPRGAPARAAALVFAAAASCATACGADDPARDPPVVAAPADASAPVDAAEEGAAPADGGGLAADAGAPAVPSACDGACRTTSVALTIDGRKGVVSRAQFGVTSAEKSATGRPELHLELHEGGDPGCPTESSPTPDRTVVVSGMRLPERLAPSGYADGVRFTLLEFGAQLTPEPLTRATDVTVVPVAQSIDLAWDGGSDAGAPSTDFVALDVRATFANGSAVGHVFATRCASLDLR